MEVIYSLVLISTTLVSISFTQLKILLNSITKVILVRSDAFSGSMMTQDLYLEVGMEVSLCGNFMLIRIPEETVNRRKVIQSLNSNSRM